MNSRLEAELSELKTSFANLLALADAGGTDIAELLTRMREKQSRLQILEAQIRGLKAQQQRSVDKKLFLLRARVAPPRQYGRDHSSRSAAIASRGG